MSNAREIGRTDEIENGTMKEITVDGLEILLAKVNDEYYATANRCPHLGGNLSQGKLEGTIVTCPRHGSQFDLKDGSVVRWMKGSGVVATIGKAIKSPRPLQTYTMTVREDKIFIET